MLYADVILPLPLYSNFTYFVPEDMRELIVRGARVLVQFGKRKFFTGIVSDLHSEAPGDYEIKPLSALLDASPIIKYPQLKLWEWIASYYLCSVGEVFKAAVPTGLKPESETCITLNSDIDITDFEDSISEKEAVILQMIDSSKKVTIAEIENKTKIKNVTFMLRPLIEKGIVEISEKVVERYKPKVIRLVRLTIPTGDSEALHDLMNQCSRSRKQERTLIAYLDLSKWLSPGLEPVKVERDALLKKAEITPGILKAMIDKGIFEIYKESINRFSQMPTESVALPPLSEAQKRAYSEILEIFSSKQIALLHGITGSGKTEIYSHLIKKVLEEGNQVLFLVPEISLTTQLTGRLRKVFGDKMLVYHSKFSDSERVDVWNKLLHSSESMLILGVRSSIFLPFSRLGLVIIDEEHESSYKQYDPAPRYNARDTALVLAAMHGAKTLLGSATPAIETYYKALSGKYGLVTLSERFSDSTLPDVEVIDMKEQRKKKLNVGILSAPLRLATTDSLQSGYQTLMFQNRRGFAPYVICKNCGWTPKCVNCDVSLVYHKYSDLLRCHYCGYSIPLPTLCPACQDNSIEVYGYGTERIAEELHDTFKDYKIVRMDLDSTRNKDSYQEIIEDFSSHRTDILVGTQMVTKGLDFGNVNVVGVLSADSLLNYPDFRSNERAFNMLEQVAGRAGRRREKGKVFVQTSEPDNKILIHVRNHDYKSYYDEEIESRRKLYYPPFSKIINIYIKNKDPKEVDEAAALMANSLRQIFGNRVLGPQKPVISRVATYYLQQIMLKIEVTASMTKVKHILRTLYESLARDPRIKSSAIYYDVDPG